MVVALKPGRFYGKSLPRPWIYGDPDTRVEPPASVNDALLKWASDAHWSMGGLSFKRSRMQGKIDGRVSKLRSQPDESPLRAKKRLRTSNDEEGGGKASSSSSKSAQPSRVAVHNIDPKLKGKAIAQEDESPRPRPWRLVRRSLLSSASDAQDTAAPPSPSPEEAGPSNRSAAGCDADGHGVGGSESPRTPPFNRIPAPIVSARRQSKRVLADAGSPESSAASPKQARRSQRIRSRVDE